MARLTGRPSGDASASRVTRPRAQTRAHWVARFAGHDNFAFSEALVFNSQHIAHRVKPRLLALAPARGRERALAKIVRSSAMWRSTMRSCGPAKITSCSPTTVPPRRLAKPMAPSSRCDCGRVRHLERRIASVRRRLAEQQCGARRRIHFHAVMHLDDLDIEIGQRFRRLLHQSGEQIDAETHVAGFDDDRRGARRRGFCCRHRRKIPSCR